MAASGWIQGSGENHWPAAALAHVFSYPCYAMSEHGLLAPTACQHASQQLSSGWSMAKGMWPLKAIWPWVWVWPYGYAASWWYLALHPRKAPLQAQYGLAPLGWH
jgi:hypothetical protein